MTHPGGLIAVAAYQHYVGPVEGRLLLYAACLPNALCRPGMADDHVETLDHYPVPVSQDPVYPAPASLFLAGDYEYVIALSQLHYTTSGAREMILMNPLSLSSRATGPKIRVPLGLF